MIGTATVMSRDGASLQLQAKDDPNGHQLSTLYAIVSRHFSNETTRSNTMSVSNQGVRGSVRGGHD